MQINWPGVTSLKLNALSKLSGCIMRARDAASLAYQKPVPHGASELHHVQMVNVRRA